MLRHMLDQPSIVEESSASQDLWFLAENLTSVDLVLEVCQVYVVLGRLRNDALDVGWIED